MAEIEFFGVRGSLPAPLTSEEIKDKFKHLLLNLSPDDLQGEEAIDRAIVREDSILTSTYGGNTSCVGLEYPDRPIIICDAGSGLRLAGQKIMADPAKPKDIILFLSHTHWDHIMGFPFFIPAYIPGYNIRIYGCHDQLKERMHYQQVISHFPITLEQMAASIEFIQLDENVPHDIEGIKVTPVRMDHPGESYSYVFEDGNSKIIYSTDSTYDVLKELEPLRNPFSNADVLIFDSMFSFSDYIEKLDWGHSTSFIGIDYAVREKTKNLFLFHHDPDYSDFKLDKIYKESLQYLNGNYADSGLALHVAKERARFSV